MNSRTSSDAFEPWQLFTLAGLIGATIVVFISKGQTPAGIVLLSLTIFTAAIVGLAAWRTMMPFTRRDEIAGPQVLGGRTRAALEREKNLVLRSIKEMEFDRAMGKLSDKDFTEMSARLRSRAGGLLRQLDAGSGYRTEIEKEIAKRVGQLPPVVRALSGAPGEPDKVRPTGVQYCTQCGTAYESDARFCRNCGANLRTSA